MKTISYLALHLEIIKNYWNEKFQTPSKTDILPVNNFVKQGFQTGLGA